MRTHGEPIQAIFAQEDMFSCGARRHVTTPAELEIQKTKTNGYQRRAGKTKLELQLEVWKNDDEKNRFLFLYLRVLPKATFVD